MQPTTDLQIISISGLIGAGKDTVGAHLIEKYGFKRFSFSSAIKDCCAIIFGLDREMLDGLTPESRAWRDEVDEWWTEKLDMGRDFTRRDLIIEIGTEIMRKWHNDIWVLCLQRQMMNLGGRVVLTDTRHLNELWMVRQMRGKIWGVHRKIPTWVKPFYWGVSAEWEDSSMYEGYEAWNANMRHEGHRNLMQRCGHEAMENLGAGVHSSEWHHLLWTDYDLILKNDSSIAALQTRIDYEMFLSGINPIEKPKNPFLQSSDQEHLESYLGKPR